MSNENTNLASGTYECSTTALRAIEARMEAGENVTWGDVLTEEQGVCLMFVLQEIRQSCPEGVDPTLIFDHMIDHDGTLVAEVDAENRSVSLDFRPEDNEGAQS